MSTIYSYINALSNKTVTPTPTDPVDLMTILNNVQTVIPSHLSLPNKPYTNIWSFYEFLKIHPFVYNDTTIISLIVPLVVNTFHLQLYCIHTVPMVNTALCKTFQTNLKNTYLAITDDEKYFTQPIDLDIMKCLVYKGHYCSQSGGLYPIQNNKDCIFALYFKMIKLSPFVPF